MEKLFVVFLKKLYTLNMKKQLIKVVHSSNISKKSDEFKMKTEVH